MRSEEELGVETPTFRVIKVVRYLERVEDLPWKPIRTAPMGRPVLLRGPSGYVGVPHRFSLGTRAMTVLGERWNDEAGNNVLDGGPALIEWCEL